MNHKQKCISGKQPDTDLEKDNAKKYKNTKNTKKHAQKIQKNMHKSSLFILLCYFDLYLCPSLNNNIPTTHF